MSQQEREMQVYELKCLLYVGDGFLAHVQQEVSEKINDPTFQTVMVEKMGGVIHHGKDLCDRHRINTCDYCGSPFYEMFGFTAICGSCLNRKMHR